MGDYQDMLISTVQKKQSFAVRVEVGGVKKYDYISPFLRELEWLTINQKHRFDVGTTVYKALREFYPDWLFLFKSNQVTTNSITRHAQPVCAAHPHTLQRQTHRCVGSQAVERSSSLPNAGNYPQHI